MGTCALQSVVFTGTSTSRAAPGAGFRRCSAIVTASSPAGASAGPIRNTLTSRCASFFIRAASAQVSVTAEASTVSTMRASTRGGGRRLRCGRGRLGRSTGKGHRRHFRAAGIRRPQKVGARERRLAAQAVGDDGIDVDDSANVEIVGNDIDDSDDNGIEVSDSFNAWIAFNDIEDSDGDGIELTDSNFSDIRWNEIDDSGDDGIDVDDSFRECFELECAAFRKVRDELGLTNVELMVPFVRTVGEAREVIGLLKKNGLERGANGLKIVMMCELPSNAILAEEFLEFFDGFSIGSNDMTQLALGLDRDSGLVAERFDELEPAANRLLESRGVAELHSGAYGAAVADFTLLLAHSPDEAERCRRAHDSVGLIVSGHTHAGQVRIPFFGPPVSSADNSDLYDQGLRRRPWTQVYTSRGLGTVHLPLRFFAHVLAADGSVLAERSLASLVRLEVPDLQLTAGLTALGTVVVPGNATVSGNNTVRVTASE